ncbi:MAG: cysteine desulfurase-like protein [Deltaproteobacteria bacterium]|nr:cysteine desulfurase-like protein [Deltaproteobacteria bacterium]
MNTPSLEDIRQQFPSLKRKFNGYPIAYLDGPGGYQVPARVIDAIADYLVNMNANVGTEFDTAQRTSSMLQNAREIFADFFNCTWDEVIFGANMTTLNFFLAQTLCREMKTGDRVLITEIDHEANRGPWLQLTDRGILVDEVALDPVSCTLDMTDYQRKLDRKTKVVALNYASNGVGTISDVKKMIDMARDTGAYTVVDAVHYASHGPLDVQELKADFLLCSAYKFFGPHIGVLYGRKNVLEKLNPLNLRTQSKGPPYMMETGTLHHEGIAGAGAAVEFIADAGATLGGDFLEQSGKKNDSRRNRIVAGLRVFDQYEQGLCRYLLEELSQNIKGITIYGPPAGHPRTSTVSFTYQGVHPEQVAKYLGSKGIFVWAGHFYAIRLVERLGLSDQGGLIRVGITPYNTKSELDRLLEALDDGKSLKAYG